MRISDWSSDVCSSDLNISAGFVLPTVASSLDIVVHLGLDAQGNRHVNEIVSVPGRVENGIIEAEQIFVRDGKPLRSRGGLPPRLVAFERMGLGVPPLVRAGCAMGALRIGRGACGEKEWGAG